MRPASGTTSCAAASSCTIGAPASTWVFAVTNTERTRPANGAASRISIFMLSTTATVSPAPTVSPGATMIETTTAGTDERMMPPSSRENRNGWPSTSTVMSGPCATVIVRYGRPPTVSRRSSSPSRSTRASHGDSVELDAIGRRRSTTDPQSVRVVAAAQLDGPRKLPLAPRVDPRSGRVETRLVNSAVVLVRLDRGLNERDPRLRSSVTGPAETAVHPLSVVFAAPELRTAQDVEQEALVRRATLHHDLALLDRAYARANASLRSRPHAQIVASSARIPAGGRRAAPRPTSTRTPGPVGIRNRRMRPFDGAKSRRGLPRSIAPRARVRSSAEVRRRVDRPRARSSCSLTRSTPDVSSVSACSTCRRGFASTKANGSPACARNSTVPTFENSRRDRSVRRRSGPVARRQG